MRGSHRGASSLAWQLSALWFDPALVTEVEVRVEPRPDGGTEATLEHRCLERCGAEAEAVHAWVESDGGWWSGLLERFRQQWG